MADVKKNPVAPRSANLCDPAMGLLYLRDDHLTKGAELMFFAYRAFLRDADRHLEKSGLGRAHHRVLHFVARAPGLSIMQLLHILQISKQALSRVSRQMVADGYITIDTCPQDRRRRILLLQKKGEILWAELIHLQHQRLADAFREAGGSAVAGWQAVLEGFLDHEERALLRKFDETGQPNE